MAPGVAPECTASFEEGARASCGAALAAAAWSADLVALHAAGCSSKPSRRQTGQQGNAARKKAQAQETQNEQRQLQTLEQAVRSNGSNSSSAPTESLLILLRQVLRNFGIEATAAATAQQQKQQQQQQRSIPLTLQIVDNILQKHPKSVGSFHSGDDSLVLALQEAAKKSQMMLTHARTTIATAGAAAAGAPFPNGSMESARKIVHLFSRARTTSQHFYPAPEILVVTDSQENYRQALRPYAFAFCEELSGHYFFRNPRPTAAAASPTTRASRSNSSNSNSMGGAQRKRLFQEMSSYQTNLPIEFGSSILVRAVEGSMDYLRVLIFGPQDTPYENGCFFFDIFLQDYPRQPPKCQFLTTGGGKYRFNPNLYNDGKVCLSLLGTWDGPSWQPNESTLYQLLISIQSLILGESEPYFNEPGFESIRNSAHGKQASQQYNQTIQSYTCAAAICP